MKNTYIFFLCIMIRTLYCSDLNNSLNNLKGTFSGSGSMLEGMGQTVGVVEGYEYSYRVFNDTPAPIAVATQRITPVLGAKFSGEVKKGAVVQPFKDTGKEFYSQNLYLDVWLLHTDASRKNEYAKYGKDLIQKDAIIGTAIPGFGSAIGALVGSIVVEKKLEDNEIFHKKIPLGKKDDKNIYFYRTYSNRGKIEGEYLGICSTTKDFVGVFFNNTSANDITLSFMKDGATYKVRLEPGTFSLLNSSNNVENSIRQSEKDAPRGFIFSKSDKNIAAIQIQPEGIATMQIDPQSDKDDPKLIPGAPYTYTYEVYEEKGEIGVGMQGLSIGNHAQNIDTKTPTKAVTRDINPVECNIWIQSAQQYNNLVKSKDPQNGLENGYDAPGSVWAAYTTQDQEMYQKLELGKTTTIRLIRPLISEKSAPFFLVAVQSKNDESAKSFLKKICSGALVPSKELSSSSHFNESLNLSTPEPTNIGIIDDTKSTGCKGWILLSDTFLPRGTGSGPFYYSIPAATINLEALMNPLIPFLSTKKIPQQATIEAFYATQASQWIDAYKKSKDAAANAIKQFLQAYGFDGITNNETLIKTLLETVVSGPVSISNLPVARQAGINNYVYSFDAKPDGWPA